MQTYKLLTLDSDGVAYLADEGFESLNDALDHLAATDLIHRLTGWSIEKCSCGYGRVYQKGLVVRGVHLEIEDDLEPLVVVAMDYLSANLNDLGDLARSSTVVG